MVKRAHEEYPFALRQLEIDSLDDDGTSNDDEQRTDENDEEFGACENRQGSNRATETE